MKIAHMVSTGIQKLGEKVQQRSTLHALENLAGKLNTNAVADLLGGTKDGAEIFMRKGVGTTMKVTTRGMSASYSYGRAAQGKARAADLFARALSNLADQYSGYPKESEVGIQVAVIRHLIDHRKKGVAVRNSRNLFAAVRLLGGSQPKAALPSPSVANAPEAVLGVAQKVLGAIERHGQRTLAAELRVGPQNKGGDPSMEDLQGSEAIESDQVARPEDRSAGRNPDPAPPLAGLGLLIKMARGEVEIPVNLSLDQAFSLNRLGVDPSAIRAKLSSENQAAFNRQAATLENRPLA
jgi:hypothetical protein